MKKKPLHYRFCDPNPPAVTAKQLFEVLAKVNAKKLHQALQDAENRPTDTEKCAHPHCPA